MKTSLTSVQKTLSQRYGFRSRYLARSSSYLLCFLCLLLFPALFLFLPVFHHIHNFIKFLLNSRHQGENHHHPQVFFSLHSKRIHMLFTPNSTAAAQLIQSQVDKQAVTIWKFQSNITDVFYQFWTCVMDTHGAWDGDNQHTSPLFSFEHWKSETDLLLQ